ncbi:DUF4391 domain-containing protein [Herbaspirillum seropedicae]|uniref:DUF4391 domain-containing protein n=1 Tax=Herbaspirillum seropedicae TaxID=964 RepID=UPI00111FFF68|nr:DUF4391 domain-containing protein [Herbaspirillum seropedicae]QDD66354.1 DUF4391 domain-containing protein [Herbaspirillum seropedicae]
MIVQHFHLGRVLKALALPAAALLEQRIPKKLLGEKAAVTTTDRRLLQDGLEELTWFAALKPESIGISGFEDATRSYPEISILVATLRPSNGAASIKRLAEIIHRAVPYPTLLLLQQDDVAYASMAHLRWAYRETDKTVLDGDVLIIKLSPATTTDEDLNLFMENMALSRHDRSNMRVLYQSWMDTLSAWQAVELTACFRPSDNVEHAAQRRSAFLRCKELDAHINSARSAAAKENQIPRQVAINLEIKALLAERQRLSQYL